MIVTVGSDILVFKPTTTGGLRAVLAGCTLTLLTLVGLVPALGTAENRLRSSLGLDIAALDLGYLTHGHGVFGLSCNLSRGRRGLPPWWQLRGRRVTARDGQYKQCNDEWVLLHTLFIDGCDYLGNRPDDSVEV